MSEGSECLVSLESICKTLDTGLQNAAGRFHVIAALALLQAVPNIALTGVLCIISGAHLLVVWRYDWFNCGESPDRARHESGARKALGDKVLQQVEQTDLMTYGLIPEFVGRFPIITALHVSALPKAACSYYNTHSSQVCMANNNKPQLQAVQEHRESA